jgi:hypothetical protein
MASPTELSQAEIDNYSIRRAIELALATEGWTTVQVFDIDDGWPEYEELVVPAAYVLLDETDTVLVPFELGSHAKRRSLFIHIFGRSNSQRVRLAEMIADRIRDIIPIYNYVTGNEESGDLDVVDYFETDNAGWRKIIQTRQTPIKERYRSLVTASLRRVAA